MIQSLLLITDSLPSKAVESRLTLAGFSVRCAETIEAAKALIFETDAVILHSPSASLSAWCRHIRSWHISPFLWWCDDQEPYKGKLLEADIDGILFSSMEISQLEWSVHLAAAHCQRTIQLMKEREHLVMRLEERKWIDQAKGILAELKQISEDAAYDFLRKQAMNERKKMVDVARSIVKVYQLIREQDNGKGSRNR